MIGEPRLDFLNTLSIEEEMGRRIIQELSKEVPHEIRAKFCDLFYYLPRSLSPPDFRQFILDTLETSMSLRGYRGAIIAQDSIDSVIYSFLPFVSVQKAREAITEIIPKLLQNGTKTSAL